MAARTQQDEIKIPWDGTRRIGTLRDEQVPLRVALRTFANGVEEHRLWPEAADLRFD